MVTKRKQSEKPAQPLPGLPLDTPDRILQLQNMISACDVFDIGERLESAQAEVSILSTLLQAVSSIQKTTRVNKRTQSKRELEMVRLKRKVSALEIESVRHHNEMQEEIEEARRTADSNDRQLCKANALLKDVLSTLVTNMNSGVIVARDVECGSQVNCMMGKWLMQAKALCGITCTLTPGQ